MNKGEQLLYIWYNKKEKELRNKRDEARDKVERENKYLKELRSIEDEFITKISELHDRCLNETGKALLNEINEDYAHINCIEYLLEDEFDEIENEYSKSLAELRSTRDEVSAHLNIVETPEDIYSIFKAYGITKGKDNKLV